MPQNLQLELSKATLTYNKHQLAKSRCNKDLNVTFHIYFWLHWVFIAVCGLSLVVVNEGYSLAAVHGLLTVVASPVAHREML